MTQLREPYCDFDIEKREKKLSFNTHLGNDFTVGCIIARDLTSLDFRGVFLMTRQLENCRGPAVVNVVIWR